MPSTVDTRIRRNATTFRLARLRRVVPLCIGLLLASTAWAEPAEPPRPEPIHIDRSDQKNLTIPDVPRDEVICFALYTVEKNVLKLSAQFYPLRDDEPKEAHLEIKQGDAWKRVATEPIDGKGWLATFRVEDWDHTQNWQYRVVHAGGAEYGGRVRRDPSDKETIVVAAFTGNSNSDRSPRADIVRNIQHQDPDLLFFSGDQSYDHSRHTAAWLLFGRQFGEIIRDRPTVTIPDDHDVGQSNLWGENGKQSFAPGSSDGGYLKSADYVNMVQRAQCSHLPDPYDATPILQDISVYYTSLNVGGIDFAIIEDRKWKTGPMGLVPKQGPRPDHINDPNYDPQTLDLPEARLLGARQLNFLDTWSNDWDRSAMKAVLSQTIFAGGAHIHGGSNQRLHADLDANGWPQSGRNRALIAMRRCFAFHIAGDQHLATVIHHGVNQWEDAGVSFCVPSIVNFYGRWWYPLEKPEPQPGAEKESDADQETGPLPFTGRYYDGFRNKVTMRAYANPTKENYNAAGYGIVRFNKTKRNITMECWPRHSDVASGEAKQFPGWPITIDQRDNYARPAYSHLPTRKLTAPGETTITVIDEGTGEVVYTLRPHGAEFSPPVFRDALYTVKETANGETREFKNLKPEPTSEAKAARQ